MKSVLAFLGIVGSIFFYLSLGAGHARGQLFEDPSKTYQNISFDMANRGSYNSSDCLYDLLNCWEAMRPDMVCVWWSYYNNLCSAIRDTCAERYGDQDRYSKKINLAEEMCKADWAQYFT